MNSLAYQQAGYKTTSRAKSTAILDLLDLVESEAGHHWEQFEILTLSAQHHLQEYDRVMSERQVLAQQLNNSLVGAV